MNAIKHISYKTNTTFTERAVANTQPHAILSLNELNAGLRGEGGGGLEVARGVRRELVEVSLGRVVLVKRPLSVPAARLHTSA